MTARRTVLIECDGCGQGSHADIDEPTATETRRNARAEGWRTGLPGGRDLCPDCVDAPEPEETT